MKINIVGPASRELTEAVAYYNDERPGLGFQFAAEVRRTIERIAEFPDAWHPLSPNTRRCRLKGFPYAVIYNHGESEILVLAIMHMRRHPQSWKARG